ncbi:MAG: HAMP domain-containing protein, partial [Chloroflexi bacterium]|nr:HAMP domain-containing protein [Chloroflexota bacterium]
MTSILKRLQRSPSGLRTQLLLGTAVPIISLLIILAVVGMFGLTRLTQTLVEQRDAGLVQLAARQIASYWADSVLLLTQVASTNAAREGDVAALQDLLSSSVALLKRYDQISVTDSQGVTIATVGGELGAQAGDQPFFERARRLRRPVRSEIHRDAQGRSVIAVAVPSYDVYGQFAGCALGIWVLGETQLGLPVANVQVGQRGYAYLVDAAGTVLYHPQSALVGSDASRQPPVAALLRGETGAQTVRMNGTITVVGYAPMSLQELQSSLFADESWTGWGLLTSELWDDLIAPLQPYVQLMIVVVLALVALPLVLLAVGSQRTVAPLQSLVTQVDRVASGRFDTQVSIDTGPSEVRELGLAFNQMVEQLRKYQSDSQNYVVSILTGQE